LTTTISPPAFPARAATLRSRVLDLALLVTMRMQMSARSIARRERSDE
jgi:hypothetical protein